MVLFMNAHAGNRNPLCMALKCEVSGEIEIISAAPLKWKIRRCWVWGKVLWMILSVQAPQSEDM